MHRFRSLFILSLAPLMLGLGGCGDSPSNPSPNPAPSPPPSVSTASTAEEGSVLPRPEPIATLDPISRRIISNRAEMVEKSPESSAAWMNYGDTCLMNLWLDEAIIAYDQALLLPKVEKPQVLWRQARALYDSGRFEDADRIAAESLALAPDHLEGWVTLASWRLEQGDLDGAEAALEVVPPGTVDPLRRGSVAIPLALQSGRNDEARVMVDELIAARPHPISSRLAVNVGNTLRDATLVQAHLATAAEGLPRIEDSWVLQLSPLARHEQADLIRAVRMRRTLPPDVALKQIRRIIGQRPRLPMLRVLTADLLKSQQKFRDAKIALDSVYDTNPPDHEYWALDALVGLRLADAGREELRERARTSSLRAVEINPTIGYGWQIRAFVLEADDDHPGASHAFSMASEHADTEAERARWAAESDRCANRATSP